MAKRYTATEKWDDPWFRRLQRDWKSAWQYLWDCCDIAGVIDLDEELADFRLGGPTDWPSLIDASNGRIVRLPSGKLYLTKFVRFQYGSLNESNRLHKAVILLLEKHEAPEGLLRALKGPKDNIGQGQGQEKRKGGAGGKPSFTPPTEGEVSAYIAEKGYQFDAEEFVDYYASQNWRKANGQRIVDWKRACGTWAKNQARRGGPSKRTNLDEAADFLRRQEANSGHGSQDC